MFSVTQMGNRFMSIVGSMFDYPQSISSELAILREKPSAGCSLDEIQALNSKKQETLRDMIGNRLAGATLDLSYVYLAGVDLSEMDLSWTDMRGAILIGAILKKTNLFQANLSGAILIEANLKEANLEEANLKGANLKGANLGWVNSFLPKTSPELEILKRRPPEGCSLSEIKELNSKKQEALQHMIDNRPAGLILNLSDVYLAGVDLREMQLYGLNLCSANLDGVNMEESDLNQVDLSLASLNGANLKGANLYEVNLCWAELKEAILDGAILTGGSQENIDLSGAKLRGTRLTGGDLCLGNMENADLRGAYLNWVDLGSVNMRLTKLTGVTLQDSVISAKMDLQGVKIEDPITLGSDINTLYGVSIRILSSNLWNHDSLDLWFNHINNPESGSLLTTIDSIDGDEQKVSLVSQLIKSLGDTDVSTVALPLLSILTKSPYIDNTDIATWLDKAGIPYLKQYNEAVMPQMDEAFLNFIEGTFSRQPELKFTANAAFIQFVAQAVTAGGDHKKNATALYDSYL